MPLNNLPGSTYLSANAFALLPFESMASKHAARQQELGYGMMLLQSMQQQGAMVQQAQQERDQLWNAISSQPVLAPDKTRLKTITDSFRARMQQIIRDEYKGDGRRFERERQGSLLNEFRQEFANSPVLAKALQNKENYALYQTAKAKGMLAMPTSFTRNEKGEVTGFDPYENTLNAYFNGQSDSISAPDLFDFPKDVLEKFGKQHRPGAQFGVYNPETKRFEAPVVTANELYQEVTNKGYDPTKAYYITKFLLGDQIGQLRWKTDQQAPWQLEKQLHDMKMDLENLGIRKRSENRQEREFQYRKAKDAQDRQTQVSMMGIFDQAIRTQGSGAFARQEQIPAGTMFPAMPNPQGGNGFTGMSVALFNEQTKAVRDLFGFSDKPKNVKIANLNIPVIGAATEVISPNTGQAFTGNFPVVQMGNEVVNTIDPKDPNRTRNYIRAKIAVDDNTAFDQNMKQSMGLWDSSTSHFQGRHKQLEGGMWNDVDEYEVLIPLPNSGLSSYRLDKMVAPNKEAAPYIMQGINAGRGGTVSNFADKYTKK